MRMLLMVSCMEVEGTVVKTNLRVVVLGTEQATKAIPCCPLHEGVDENCIEAGIVNNM